MKEIKDLQEEFCSLVPCIAQGLLRLGFKVKDVVEKGLIWSEDPSDPLHKDVMVFMSAGEKEFWLIEITPEIIAVKTPEDEQVICNRYLSLEGVTISGFDIADLPFLRFGPMVIEKLDQKFDAMLAEYLESLEAQPILDVTWPTKVVEKS